MHGDRLERLDEAGLRLNWDRRFREILIDMFFQLCHFVEKKEEAIFWTPADKIWAAIENETV